MTTMFVQLRRVVYLLVLLHFCTCVAYANESSVNDDNCKQKIEEFKDMQNELKKIMIVAEDSLIDLDKEFGACDDYSLRALNAVDRLESLTKGAEAGMSPIHTSTSREEMKEQRKKFETALQEANDVLSNVTLALNKTRKAAEELNKTLTEVEGLSNDIISEATEFKHSPPKVSPSSHHLFLEMEKIVRDSKRESEEALSFVAERKSRVQMAFDTAKKAEEQAESLKVAVQAFNEYLEKHGLKPEDSTADSHQNTSENEFPKEEKESDKVTPGNKNVESKLESSHGMVTNTKEENTAQLQHSSHEEVKNVHMNTTKVTGITKESSNDERVNNIKPEENNTTTQKRVMESQSNREQRVEEKGTKGISNKDNKSFNASTTTNDVDSHKTSSESSTSVSMHLNVAQLSDSSSSPVLVHSPLLLLLVSMCVLGCTVLC
ncbi:uncharacterized protein TM35_000821030 [Trypanosoma theileri]|uniref:Uncharacterized protein n=1 Tax=Trypanosoma theileri TaxID=67003 RepID=A0A1X0NET8_9TRYP|nr:uncharacterized protein TM35_000821030 [Trypanosoma theileri]ORC82813.1 hypothetical protein TM35_000821030 [Trypanosoma theileri]